MGRTELASAKHLRATWGEGRRSVVLHADGEKPGNCRDVRFVRITRGEYVGFDPIYELVWTSGTGPFVQEDYMVDQIENVHFELPRVVIRTKEHAKGKLVDIGDVSISSTGDVTVESLPAAPASAPRPFYEPGIPMIVKEGKVFELNERIPDSPEAMVDIEYDDKLLKMVGASYCNGNIYWKLVGLHGGHTTEVTITVWTIPGIGTPRKQVRRMKLSYHVHVRRLRSAPK